MAEHSEGAASFPKDLLDAAAQEGRKSSRPPLEQLEHWARVGRLLTSGDRTRTEAALAGLLPLHAMTEHERVIVNAETNAKIEAAVTDTTYTPHLEPAALETVALDEAGRLIRHHADGSESVLDDT